MILNDDDIDTIVQNNDRCQCGEYRPLTLLDFKLGLLVRKHPEIYKSHADFESSVVGYISGLSQNRQSQEPIFEITWQHGLTEAIHPNNLVACFSYSITM